MQLGIKVTKVHRIIEYRQVEIFKDYINTNTEKRAATDDPFKRDFFKYKNNSLFGKTIENVKDRKNLRLVNNPLSMITYHSPFFRKSTRIAEGLISVTLAKENVELNRPSYIGQVVLDLSKLRMYQLQYIDLERYRQDLNCEIKIVAGDTDSFFLQCKNVDLRTTDSEDD